jgi:hypothetical protein
MSQGNFLIFLKRSRKTRVKVDQQKSIKRGKIENEEGKVQMRHFLKHKKTQTTQK